MTENLVLKIKRMHKNAKIPFYANPGDAGMDLCSVASYLINPHERVLVATGWAVEVPLGYEMQIRPRSGLALKEGITVLNTPGTVDSGYRNEIGVILQNHSNNQEFWNKTAWGAIVQKQKKYVKQNSLKVVTGRLLRFACRFYFCTFSRLSYPHNFRTV